MLVLTQPTDTLQIVLESAATTHQLSCVASWRDITATPTYTPGRSLAATNDTTDVSLVAAPAASTQRLVDHISIYNADTVNATVTLKIDASGTEYVIAEQEIRPGQTWIYTSNSGFSVIGTPVESDWTFVVLGSNATTTLATPTSTALAFTPDASSKYEIEGKLFLETAVTTVGPRPGISWPSGLSQNAAMVIAPNSATAFATNFWGPAAAGNAAATGLPAIDTDYYAQVAAMLITGGSPTGDFAITIQSETAANEVRIMANSFIRYRKYV